MFDTIKKMETSHKSFSFERNTLFYDKTGGWLKKKKKKRKKIKKKKDFQGLFLIIYDNIKLKKMSYQIIKTVYIIHSNLLNISDNIVILTHKKV